MTEITASGPNAEQIKYWNERGSTWVQLQEMLDQQLRPLGVLVMERAGIAAGQRVLDVGCGCGDTTVSLAQRVGATGTVVGIDISTPMLAQAEVRAAAAGLSNVLFQNADAQTATLPSPSFDVIFSRFGVMFFVEPAVAFGNLRRHLRPGGKLAFACWQALSENPWMFVPFMAAAQHVVLPPPPAPDAPGPFAFADRDKVDALLRQAGFAGVQLESVREELAIAAGASLDQAVDFMLQMGPTAQMMRDADPKLVDNVRSSVREALAPYATNGGLVMPSAAWIVTASAP